MAEQHTPASPLRARLTTLLIALAFPTVAGVILFAAAGRWDLPNVWAVLALLALFYGALALTADPSLLRERQAPGPGSQDRLTRALSGPLLVGHWVLAGLDVGRFQWSVVPPLVQFAGVAGYAVCLLFLFWAMTVNRFYSSVVRVQKERGQQVISVGPYRWVRHPGYAFTILGALCGGVALGSWVALLPVVAFIALFVRRTLLEDRMLRQELDGYEEYARQVRYRLVYGIF